ncbi:MAG: neutral/alkaline non-lysosomal ceramidase N-terminal domain-containing protein [Pirellulales bacterium]|nr:neutral/alkaline non-lysosomal ceramidase N-terminal domain-containing protein [Pirellulales bacterium]
MRANRTGMFLAILFTALALMPASRTTAAETIPVGVAKVDITPEMPVRMYGYASRKSESEGIAGRLKAAALAIGGDEGEGPAVLLSVDCGAVPADLRAEVLRRAQTKAPIKPERFMLANSHNHSGPNLKGMQGLEGQELEHLTQYAKELTDRLEEVVLKALASRQPGQLAWTQGTVAFAANRRVLKDGKWIKFGAVPEGPADHSLPLLRVTDAQGNPIALVVNYACHNTTLRGDFKQIHGDWAACAQESIEADHPGTVAMITIGCGADSDPCPHGTVELCRQHGRAMADEVKRLMAGPFKPIEPELTARRMPLEVPFLEPPPIEELRQYAVKSYAAQRLLKLIEKGEKPPTSETYEIATWTFGNDLAMIFLSDEVVVDYAVRLKREMDGGRLWINAYSNDVSSYIASKRIIGEGGYEAWNSLSATISYGRPEQVQPAIEDRIVERVKELLPEGFRRGARPSSGGESPQASRWQFGKPIVTYWAGPPMTDATAAQMAEGAWNLVWCQEDELDNAHRHGLRAMLQDGLLTPKSLESDEAGAKLGALIERVRNHPALYAYFLTDEPSAAAFADWGKLVAYLRQRDPGRLPYINLFPTYASNAQLGTQGDTVNAYAEHLRQYVETVKPALISYDHYHFSKQGDNAQYFLNLAMIREAAMKAGVPFLNIVQACTWTTSMRVPNGDELRFLVYTSLAYGAQGISYYVYCHPGHEGAMANADGTPTPLYHAAKEANRDFARIAAECQPLRSLGVYHLGMIPPGGEPLPEKSAFGLDPAVTTVEYHPPAPIQGFVLGLFGESDKPTHALVVNLDYKQAATTAVVGPGPLTSFAPAAGTWSTPAGPRLEVQLPPGGGRLVRVTK